MYGFDNIMLSLCLSMPSHHFGIPVSGKFAIPAYWQSLWNALPQLTTGIGAWLAGPITDGLGRRTGFGIAGLLSAAGVSVIYTATTPSVFLADKMVKAVGLGMTLTTGQTYVSEIAPVKLRGVALSAYTFCMNLGFLVAASIAFNRVTTMDESAYKVMFAAEWVWPGLLLVGFLLIPESPYHLANKSRPEDAAKSLATLYAKGTAVQPILQAIVSTIQAEEYVGDLSFKGCFCGIHWRRTRIVLYANGLPQMIGATFIANAPYFMIVAGVSPTNTAMMVELGIGISIISSFFTCWALTAISRVLVMGGTAFAGVLFFIMGVASSLPTQSSASLWCTGITLQLVWLTMGPAIGPAMSIAGEVSAVRLRARTSSIDFLFNYIYSTAWNIVVPYMFNADQGNLVGKVGWIYLGTCLIALVILWFEFPNTKDLTFAEIDERFEIQVPTREFRKWQDQTPGHPKEEAFGTQEHAEFTA